MNAYGFAQWYANKTPLELRMAKEFHRRWLDHAGLAARADADVDDVPDQSDFIVKNTATLALQLLKRFRNIRYASYTGRIPPSVMLSYYAGLAAQPNMSLSAMLVRLASWIIRDIEQASLYRRLLHVANPVCAADVFTDRWPESIAQQDEFAEHLHELVRSLEVMRKGEMFPDAMMDDVARRLRRPRRDPCRRPDRHRDSVAGSSSPVSSTRGGAACCCLPPQRSRRRSSTRRSRRRGLTPSSGARSDGGGDPLHRRAGRRDEGDLAAVRVHAVSTAAPSPLGGWGA